MPYQNYQIITSNPRPLPCLQIKFHIHNFKQLITTIKPSRIKNFQSHYFTMIHNELLIKDAYYFKFYCNNSRTPICGSNVLPTLNGNIPTKFCASNCHWFKSVMGGECMLKPDFSPQKDQLNMNFLSQVLPLLHYTFRIVHTQKL